MKSQPKCIGLPLNPNGRSELATLSGLTSTVWIYSAGPRDMWIIDFGADMLGGGGGLYELPFEYVRKYVKPERDK